MNSEAVIRVWIDRLIVKSKNLTKDNAPVLMEIVYINMRASPFDVLVALLVVCLCTMYFTFCTIKMYLFHCEYL